MVVAVVAVDQSAHYYFQYYRYYVSLEQHHYDD